MNLGGLSQPALRFPVLVIESDDWGADEPARVEAQAVALGRLHQVLAGVRDAFGRPAVAAIGLVSGTLDRAGWRATGRAARRTLADASQRRLVDALREGQRAGVFAIQWHGLEHYWPATLMAAATRPEVRAWLESDAPTEALPDAVQTRWVDCSVLPSRPLPAPEVERAVQEEAAILRELFGVLPPVAVPNTFVWTDTVEAAWRRAGVRFVVTCGRRHIGRDAEGALVPEPRALTDGMTAASGVTYLVRDVYFEPARGHGPEDVLARLSRKARQGRPCLVESHRFNYLGDDADASFHALSVLLKRAREAFPDLRFASTEEIGTALVERDQAWVRSLGLSQWLSRFVGA